MTAWTALSGKLVAVRQAWYLVPLCALFLAVFPCAASDAAAPKPGEAAAAHAAAPGAELAAARAEAAAHPESAPAQIRLGYLLAETGALEEALGQFDRALVIAPRAFEAKTGRGMALTSLGRYPEAEKALRDALLLNPNPVRVHYELGVLYRKTGEYQKAVDEFKEGIRKHRQGRN